MVGSKVQMVGSKVQMVVSSYWYSNAIAVSNARYALDHRRRMEIGDTVEALPCFLYKSFFYALDYQLYFYTVQFKQNKIL